MASQFDPSDFVDSDFQASRQSPFAAPSAGATANGEPNRAPTREEVEARVSDAQTKLAELKRAQEELERERSSLEETRRRHMEFQNGRGEMMQSLTRGLTLLQEAEFATRRDADQMAKSVAGLKEAFEKVKALNEQGWTKENYGIELTRALALIENSRLEWSSARSKFSVLSDAAVTTEIPNQAKPELRSLLATQNFGQLCKIGFALTWPVALVGLGIFALLFVHH